MKFGIKNRKLLISEIVLLIASVFVFRSLWLLLDTFSFMHKPGILLVSLILGILFTIPAYRYIIKNG
ncbi:MAG: hypothetical protein KBD52_01765 [Candidatus Pacebacteria bacterium]|nr:hypothetical protein [Candidatus Paceibacterota bacterium]